ncbi:hypothetical protein [Bacillus sp. Marseille-Q3570]|uniref:hypothetical protein n=1 Tax=Bacillus sp. Marseille-Q3570 TaxID=2963522 RepID=UPI0021B71516|nr:hypothetical protein [Bacillus sp. Marseille-Q3570]
MTDKQWRIMQIIWYAVGISGGFCAVYFTSEHVGNGLYRMVVRPSWFNWVIGLVVLSVFMVTFIEVRSRNGGVINGKVIRQTLLWIGVTVGGLMFVWYSRGDF